MIEYKKLLIDQITPIEIFHRVGGLFPDEISFLFESAINNENGSFSYIVIGAKERIVHKNSISKYIDIDGNIKIVEHNPLIFLQKYYKNIDTDKYTQLLKELGVGYIDGFIGYIGYDMVKEFEPVLKQYMDNLKDDIDIPDLDMIRPHLVLVYSHKSSTLTLVSQTKKYIDSFDDITKTLHKSSEFIKIQKSNIASKPYFSLSKDEFFDKVEKSKQKIKSGDIFQILISNRYTQETEIDPFSFYRILRSKNPSPYMYLLNFEDFSIAGSSPEVMVSLQDKEILLRPIAGTRKRGKNRARDYELELEMINDNKEKAEHLMLVDLGRNDVGRVAKKGTVNVPELMRVERYSHVMHMVSDVLATIDDKYDMFDLFMATFTAGTMTGAPKIKAMQLIAEFEGIKRGFYSGSIGYFGFDGNMDSSITIRTALIKKDKIFLQSGAGIVSDSIDELEFLEIQNKLNALISTIKDLTL